MVHSYPRDVVGALFAVLASVRWIAERLFGVPSELPA